MPARVSADDLEVRPWREDDARALGAAITASLEHLRPWMAWAAEEPIPEATRRARIWAWSREGAAGGTETYGMFLDGTVVGGSGLHHRLGVGGLEIGYWVHVDFLRRGIAATTTRVLLDRAFARPSTRFVEVHHDVANVASGAVPAGVGFTHVRDEAKAPTAPAETGTERIWRMERSDWRSAPAPA